MGQSLNTEETIQERMNGSADKEISEISEIIENSDIRAVDKERIIGYMEEFKGPLPHPQILRQYEEIQAGLANEIVSMAMKEQEHRHGLENKLVESEVSLNSGQLEMIRASINLKSRLQIFGFFSTTLLLIIGASCIYFDKDAGSIGAFILAIGSFCWTMFYGKKNPDKENEDREAEENE